MWLCDSKKNEKHVKQWNWKNKRTTKFEVELMVERNQKERTEKGRMSYIGKKEVKGLI